VTYDFSIRKMVATGDYGLRVVIEPGDPAWCMLTPYGAIRPWCLGSWRNVALWSLGKMLAWRDWNRKNEVLGIGIIKGKCPAGTSEPDRLRFGSDVGSLGRNSKIILTEGFDVEVDDRAGADSSGSFRELIKLANDVIAISHLGQNLSTQVDGGSYAAATAHNAVRQDYLEADAQVVSTAIHDQLLVHWSKYNNKQAPWPVWCLKQPEDAKVAADVAKTRAESIKTIAEAAKLLKELGIDIDVDELIKSQVSIQEKSEGDEEEELKGSCCHHVELSQADALASPKGQDIVDEAVSEALSANELAAYVDEVLREIQSTKDEPGWELDLTKRLNAMLAKPNASVERFARAMEQALVVAKLAVGVDEIVESTDEEAE
jgi:phage gp29-like protein